MRVADFDFDLPEELIAQTPPEPRGSSRMLRLDRSTGACNDDLFANFPNLLKPGDLLILNDSRVLPARLFATRARSMRTQTSSPSPSGRIEILLTQQLAPDDWSALVRPARKVVAGETLLFHDAGGELLLSAEVLAEGEFGERTLRFPSNPDFYAKLDRLGHMPLPPYIHRLDEIDDKSRYQTVFAARPGSAAAPTAGLHFTPEILLALRQHGVQVETITLHVGLGTFQPVRVDSLAEIRLHSERYTLPSATASAINQAQAEGRRIFAAGTTVTRTLEHCAAISPHPAKLEAHSGATSIFLAPGHRFRVVSGLLTNFHLPQSTLLMLVSAFLAPPGEPDHGRKVALAAYDHAIAERYRFFSYGDCMLIA